MDIILRPKSKGKVFCLLASVSFLVLAKINKLREKTKFLQIYFLQMPIDTTIEKGYTTTISITFSTTYAPKHIFTSYLRFLKASYGFPKKSKNIKPKLSPVFLGRISFFVYFAHKMRKIEGGYYEHINISIPR